MKASHKRKANLFMPTPGNLFPSYANPSTWRQEHDDEYLKTKKWEVLKAETLERAGYLCQYCGYKSMDNQVHHMNGDHSNNSEKNLVVACSWCHMVIHSGLYVSVNEALELYEPTGYSQIEVINITREMRTKGKSDKKIKAYLGLVFKRPFRMNRAYLKRLIAFPTEDAPIQKSEEKSKTTSRVIRKPLKLKGALKHSFCIFPGVGHPFEKYLFENGIKEWKEFLERPLSYTDPRSAEAIRTCILEAITDLKKGRADYLKKIPRERRNEIWRSYETHREKCLYIDIETTGLNPMMDSISLIGTYDGNKTQIFQKGKNLKQFPKVLKDYSYVVTYNGSTFDMHIIQREFPSVNIDQINWDLRWPAAKLGIKGGLSSVERHFGLKRGVEFPGVIAVDLWKEYRRGNGKALNVLQRRVLEDCTVLKPIAERIYNRLLNQSLCAEKVKPLIESSRKGIPIKCDNEWFKEYLETKMRERYPLSLRTV